MKYVSAFNGKTLHDGTNRFSISKLPITLTAEVEKVRMANGALFDPNYGTGSQTVPGPFSAKFLMRFATKAEAEAEEAAIAILIGSNGDVTASFNSGAAAQTCNATLKTAVTAYKNSDLTFTVTLNFEPFKDFS